MDRTRLQQMLGRIAVCAVVFLVLVYFGVSPVTQHTDALPLSGVYTPTAAYGAGTRLEQVCPVDCDTLKSFSVVSGGRNIHASVYLLADNEPLYAGHVDMPLSESGGDVLTISLPDAGIDLKGKSTLTFVMDMEEGTECVFFYGNTYRLARGEVRMADLDESTSLKIGNDVYNGRLGGVAEGVTVNDYRMQCLIACGILLVMVGVWYLFNVQALKKDRITLSRRIILTAERYSFLLKQMVSRDFKTKYRRSVLGVLWSFLNPLMTMAIQYLVFSMLFSSSILHYPVYLLSGIVTLNFFNEATTTGLTSITGNTNLLTKVYIPKYIFPFARVTSAAVNCSFSLIPLLLAVFISGIVPSQAWLALPFVLVCLFVFATGISMILTTMMVYFRDIQFLWGVVLTLLSYVTPIFYPETILPEKVLALVRLNPLYHVLKVFRGILMEGAVPGLDACMICAAACLACFVVGLWVFKRHQDDFVLYL